MDTGSTPVYSTKNAVFIGVCGVFKTMRQSNIVFTGKGKTSEVCFSLIFLDVKIYMLISGIKFLFIIDVYGRCCIFVL